MQSAAPLTLMMSPPASVSHSVMLPYPAHSEPSRRAERTVTPAISAPLVTPLLRAAVTRACARLAVGSNAAPGAMQGRGGQPGCALGPPATLVAPGSAAAMHLWPAPEQCVVARQSN